MGQLIGGAAKPKRCNLNMLSQLGTPAAGEHILVSSDNSMNAAGQGNFDCYIEGDGQKAATALPLKKTYANDVDDVPTAGSDKLVKSGGVYSSTPTTANSEAESDLDISDEEGNVLVRFSGGHLQVKNFHSADVLDSIQAILSNVGFDNIPEFNEEDDYVVGDIVRYEKYVYVFTSAHTAGEWDETEVEKTVIKPEFPVEVSDDNEADLDISDEIGNAVVRFAGGHIKTQNFDSKDIVDKDIMSMPNKVDSLFGNKFQLDTEYTYNLLNPSDFDGADSGFIPISPENGDCVHMHFLEYIQYNRATNTRESININPFSTFCRFYDSNKDIISINTSTSYVKAIPNNAAFIKIRLIDAKYKDVAFLSYDVADATVSYSRGGIEHREYPKELGFTKTGYEDFTIVCFGDSITQGLERKPLNISYVSYLEDILHCHTINVGFGGTRMAYVGSTPLFSFANLVDVIVSDAADKWDALDEYVKETLPAFTKHLNNLKNIDWSKVDAISVFYGMNDYAYQANGTQIGEEGTMDKTTYNGACAYALDKLLTKFPWLQVILITPYDRYMDANTNSSNTANSVGKYMKDYADSLVGVQNLFRCPILDFYREGNINKYSYKTMLADGVHAYVYPAVKRLAKMLAECIMNKLY